MFTVEQIKAAHSEVKSGADFPNYIQAIKRLGVVDFVTWVTDSRTDYFGDNGFKTSSEPQYSNLVIAEQLNKEQFGKELKHHQQGGSDYYTFCQQAAAAGIEKWVVSLEAMTCVYYDRAGGEVLVETIPG